MSRFRTQYQSTNPFLAQSDVYRYGFNGMEDVTEFNGIDFSARVYSSHLARFRSIDPKSGSILVVSLSPYHFALNSPIIAIDANGEIWNIVAGVIAGAVAGVITAVVTDRDDPYYWQKVAAAGIGTAVGVATFGAAAPALIAGAGGAATIGTTGTLYINGLTAIGSAVIGAGVEQGILVVSGAQNEIDENEILMSGVLAIPELFLSKGADAMFKPALKKTQSKMVSSAVEAAQKSWSRQVREVANGIKKKYNLNRKTADAIAERIAEESLESEVQFVTWTAKLKTEGVLEIAVNIATEMSEMEFKEAVDSGRMNSNSSRMQSTVVAFDMKTQQE
ncbi:MAG: RHS repeat domain-containing protein [Flavobacteriales bacterium]|jgi:RHS repeat-associated protein